MDRASVAVLPYNCAEKLYVKGFAMGKIALKITQGYRKWHYSI